MAKLREHNISKLSEVKAVVFETTGEISVISKRSDNQLDKDI